jgi:hypothetical protein
MTTYFVMCCDHEGCTEVAKAVFPALYVQTAFSSDGWRENSSERTKHYCKAHAPAHAVHPLDRIFETPWDIAERDRLLDESRAYRWGKRGSS